MAKKPIEPFLWGLFSAGGVVAALLIPVHLFLFGLAFPLGWLTPPGYESLHALASHSLARIYLFVLCSFSLFHWAHRFRYTLYDGLQIKHLNEVITVFCYGGVLAARGAKALLRAGQLPRALLVPFETAMAYSAEAKKRRPADNDGATLGCKRCLRLVQSRLGSEWEKEFEAF